MDNLKKEIGIRIRNRRKEFCLTQEKLAELLNISVKHFSEVERGLAGLSLENLIKLSDILCVSIDYLVKGVSNNESPENIHIKLNDIEKEKVQLLQSLIDIAVQLSK